MNIFKRFFGGGGFEDNMRRVRPIAELFYSSFDSNPFNFQDINTYGFVSMAKNINAIEMPLVYLCDLFKSGKINAFDKEGNLIEGDPLVSRLNEPNRFQSKEEFLWELFYFTRSAGWSFVLPKSKSVGFEKDLTKVELFNLNPDNVEFKDFKAPRFEIDGLNFKFYISSEKFINLRTADVINFYDTTISTSNPYVGVSRLANLRDEADNTRLADRGKKNKIKRSGSMLISHKERNGLVSDGLDLPVVDSETPEKRITMKQQIEAKLNGIGLAQGKSIVVSSKELGGFSLAKDLIGIDFDEMKEADLRVISNKIGVPYELLPTRNQQATYENRVQAELSVIQRQIEPFASSFAKSIQAYFNYDKEIRITYDHLPAYQVAREQKQKADTDFINSVVTLLNAGIITSEEARERIENKEL